MARQELTPSLAKGAGVQIAVDRPARLLEVDGRVGLVEAVKEHAFLHWRQRVDVFDAAGGDRRQLLAGESRVRKVRWRHPTGPGCRAVRDQRLQLTFKLPGQTLDGASPVQVLAEMPVDPQATRNHAAVDLEDVGTHATIAALGTPRLRRGREQP